MLDIQTIKNQYPKNLQKFDRGLLREYLQYQILAIIFEHPVSRKLSFLGGTCLRIAHQLPRFSEDIDFDNKKLSEMEFEELASFLAKELEKRGYLVEIKLIKKNAFHCCIKFPDLLYQQGLTPQKYEKILIQVDTFDQGEAYESKLFILDKFEFFKQIKVTPKPVILSQKLWTITQRPRFKGRDFFDIMFLLQSTQPDETFLKTKFNQKEITNIVNEILSHLKSVNWKNIVEDIKPFLHNPDDADKIHLFPDFLKQKLSIPRYTQH
ncbi:MAG: nucleotidyl transferase AbiEii/AbiGii toxin family protein [Patescibacteria group bacterium]|nr:nucleotidyl transferase AbiEii/AbiGii toxin family protein [Patescibacteria group bacterium]